MVQKIAKNGVYSGNTLRASNSRFHRQYKRQACLVRHVENVSKEPTFLNDLNITANDVIYSLNKKARWRLPQVMKERIKIEANAHDNLKIDVVESHKLNRTSNAIEFHSTKGPMKNYLPKTKTYFNAKSFSTPKKSRRSRRTRQNTQVEDPDVEVQKTPLMTIDVLYPCPASSSIMHNPKYMRTDILTQDSRQTGDDEFDDKPQDSKPTKSKSKKQRKRINIKGKSTSELLDDIFSEDEEEDDLDVEEECLPRTYEVMLNDILAHTSKLQQLCIDNSKVRPEQHNATNPDRKSKKVYIEKEETQTTGSGSAEVTDKLARPALKPVHVSIPSVDVQPEHLKAIYGDEYIECNCFPRKFIVDISKRTKNLARKSKAFKNFDIYKKELSAIVIFVYDVFSGLDATENDTFSVYINMKSSCQSLQIETLNEYQTMRIDEIIQLASQHIELIPFHLLCEKTSATCGKKETDFQMLTDSLNIRAEKYHPKEITLHDKLLQPLFCNQDDEDSLHGLGFESLPPETCNICLENLEDKSSTALQSCGHWFCDECWRDHLITRIGSGSMVVTCPEYKCKAVVSKTVIITIANFHLFEQLCLHELDDSVNADNNKKWCPNPECGRIIKLTAAVKGMNVTCECGIEICFDCNGPAHWPLSCKQALPYWSDLQLRKDGNPFLNSLKSVDSVRGKNCPSCKRFIEKFGGCFSMSCVCGVNFCWGCGQPRSTHVTTAKCNPGKEGDNVDTEVKEIDYEESHFSRTKYYEKAVRSRVLRHPQKMTEMKSNMFKFCTNLKAYVRIHGTKCIQDLAMFDFGHGNVTFLEKIKPFIECIMKIYSEIHQILEYGTIFLENLTKSPSQPEMKRNLKKHLSQLDSMSDAIFFVFTVDMKESDIRSVIPTLWKLRFQSKKAILGLVQVFKE